MEKDYAQEYFWEVMPFLVGFFVLYSTMVFIFNLVNRSKSTLLELLGLFVNAGIFFGAGYILIEEKYDQTWVAALTLGLVVFYVGHIYYFLIRKVHDRELLISFTGLAAFFLTVTVPLILSAEWITVSWAIQAFVMLWIAGKLRSEFLRQVAYLLYVIVIGRFCIVDLHSQFSRPLARDIPLAQYVLDLVQRLIVFGVPVGSMAAAYRLLNRTQLAATLTVEKANDIGQWVRERWVLRALFALVLAMLFIYLHLELNRTFGYMFPPVRMPVLTLLWLAMCFMLLFEYRSDASTVVFGLLTAFVAGLLIKLFFFDLPGWHVAGNMRYLGDYSFLDAGMRLLDFGVIIAFFALAFSMLFGEVKAQSAANLFAALGVVLLFVYTTLELNTFLYHFVPDLRPGGISILWSLFALAMIITGIAKNERQLRYLGLGLFAVVTWKIFFNDLARLDQLYRIIAFILLGALVLSGSFVYLKYRQVFATEPVAPEQEPGEKE
jgi:uncharacterized membrane protein